MNGCVVELMTTQAGPYEISTIFMKLISFYNTGKSL